MKCAPLGLGATQVSQPMICLNILFKSCQTLILPAKFIIENQQLGIHYFHILWHPCVFFFIGVNIEEVCRKRDLEVSNKLGHTSNLREKKMIENQTKM